MNRRDFGVAVAATLVSPLLSPAQTKQEEAYGYYNGIKLKKRLEYANAYKMENYELMLMKLM